MKIVILAAGSGSRLGSALPKPLVRLSGETSILGHQIKHLSAHLNPHDIQLVVGFKKDLFMEAFPDLCFIYNPYYDRTNTARSLLLALRKNHGEAVLWLNGDVVFEPGVLPVLMPHVRAEQSFVCVNRQLCGEEEVKYCLDGQGFISGISKTIENGMGEALGINFVARKDIPVLINHLEACKDMDFFEKGMERAIQLDGLEFKPVDLSPYHCLEVDFREDLRQARKLFKR